MRRRKGLVSPDRPLNGFNVNHASGFAQNSLFSPSNLSTAVLGSSTPLSATARGGLLLNNIDWHQAYIKHSKKAHPVDYRWFQANKIINKLGWVGTPRKYAKQSLVTQLFTNKFFKKWCPPWYWGEGVHSCPLPPAPGLTLSSPDLLKTLGFFSFTIARK